jgi:hypothetical protein
LRDGGFEFADSLSGAPELSKVFSFACLRLLEADEAIARDRLVARALGTQLSIHH